MGMNKEESVADGVALASGVVKKSISIEADIWAGAEERAKEEMRTPSNYIAWLIAQDLERGKEQAEVVS